MASALNWIPDTLYNMTISSVVSNYNCRQNDLQLLPDNVRFDIYYELYNQGRLCDLAIQCRKLDVFSKMLTVCNKRHLLHHCFQALMDHGSRVADSLSKAYIQHCRPIMTNGSLASKDSAIRIGFSLGGFLNDAGWFEDSEKVLMTCQQLCTIVDDTPHSIKALDCCIRLLHVRNAFCKFDDAEVTYQESLLLVDRLKSEGLAPNLAALYAEFSLLFFVKSYYDLAYQWSYVAMKELDSNLPPKIVIDVLRQAAKACVVKREFKRSELLIKQAVYMAREHFGCIHPKFSDALIDFGFFLLNIDCVSHSVQVYQIALDIRKCTFGGKNIHVAVAHEDLAYASYVNEYSSGKFQDAQSHADKAMDIMCHLLSADHLLLASSKRVKALILEEIAIDNQDKDIERQQLLEAQELHLSALQMAKKAFGERNVQTAKHYGNLGRLYQSMQRYDEAELMHRQAIKIKEELLGLEDYEVSLSVGHLASLYNYDMDKYDQAKELYLRSIAIANFDLKWLEMNGFPRNQRWSKVRELQIVSRVIADERSEQIVSSKMERVEVEMRSKDYAPMHHFPRTHTTSRRLWTILLGSSTRSDWSKKLFGEGYSGLEYDYRGLIRVYSMLDDYAKISEYNAIYHHWKQLRDSTEARQNNPLQFDQRPMPVEEIVQQFFAMDQSNVVR